MKLRGYFKFYGLSVRSRRPVVKRRQVLSFTCDILSNSSNLIWHVGVGGGGGNSLCERKYTNIAEWSDII